MQTAIATHEPQHHDHHEMPAFRRRPDARGDQRHAALPHRLRDRRGARHGHRHGARVLRARDRRAGRRPRVRVRLRADEPAAAARRADGLGSHPDRARGGHAEHRDDGDRRQRPHARDPRSDGSRRRQPAVLGQPVVRARHRRHDRRTGQPLADRPRQGSRGRPRDRHPRRTVAADRRHRRGLAFVFGSSVLLAEIANGSDGAGHGATADESAPGHGAPAGAGHERAAGRSRRPRTVGQRRRADARARSHPDLRAASRRTSRFRVPGQFRRTRSATSRSSTTSGCTSSSCAATSPAFSTCTRR